MSKKVEKSFMATKKAAGNPTAFVVLFDRLCNILSWCANDIENDIRCNLCDAI